jgi:surface protein
MENLIINSSNTRISIGNGSTGQTANTMILNASGQSISVNGPTGGFYVKPVRYVSSINIPSGFFITAFNPTTSEIIYWGTTGGSYSPPGATGTDVTFTINLPTASTVTFNSSASQPQITPSSITSINWGDGSTIINNGVHTYSSSGTYTIRVIGGFTQFPTDPSFTPLITNVASFTGITNMSYMFLNNITFNQDISGWITTDVTDMSYMFSGARGFDKNLSGWDTGNVVNMSNMFKDAIIFNSNIGSWNTINVTNMSSMFRGASAFNQDIGLWRTINVTNMSEMFMDCIVFNQNLNASGSEIWNTSNVTNMSTMFNNARAFNGNITLWNTSNVTDMNTMFRLTLAFNQPINKSGNSWNTSNVTNMSNMFAGSIFNQAIGNWDTSKVIDMNSMFGDALLFNQPIGNWDTSFVTNMANMFSGAIAFYQDISTWPVPSLTNLYLMFRGSGMRPDDITYYRSIMDRKRTYVPLGVVRMFFQELNQGTEPT